ncbi:DUF5672 family protein [Sphingomonas glaciei]|uniref:DUF5672 domain-containing protein n=1 Tax=Sphingomonas glaciei TaxID=2938948 RepID=A0ABY5MXM1_9SPHN|nr:DUF5672 family protein [Sphingomonas glaciei]UUR08087.1 hypothetical protein M1K48_00075 [Sphingomonas glaciei]
MTLVAATSVNVDATLAALRQSMRGIDFAAVKLLTDDRVEPGAGIERIAIPAITSAPAYSHFILRDLIRYVSTQHVMVVQWDGFVTQPSLWRAEFLLFDYVGALWPQFGDGHDVGNGGFSLRSRKLLEACLDPAFKPEHPEDVAIGRTNRRLLEEKHGIRFADARTARRFSRERDGSSEPSLGFHGVFNMIEALGAERFWQTYSSLDERRGIGRDLFLLAKQLRGAGGRHRKRLRLFRDLAGEELRRRLGR